MERSQLALAGVARGVDRLVTRVDYFSARAVQVIDDPTDRPLVARNRVRTEDHGVVGADLEVAGVATREFGERGEGLTLAAGADDAHLTWRELSHVLDIDEIRRLHLQKVQLTCKFDV